MTKTNNNGNGATRRMNLANLVITVLVLVVGIAVVWGASQATLESISKEIAKLDKCKVEKDVYEECVRNVEREMREIKVEQHRTSDKLDKILEKL